MQATTDVLELDKTAQDLLFREARTANAFSAEPVSDDQVAAIYDLVKYAPTSMNVQPLRIVLVRTPEARERLVRHMSEGNKAKTSTAPLSVILAYDPEFHEHLPTQFPHFAGAQAAFKDQPRRFETAKFNALLQVGYFILGVRAAGLAAGPMTGFDAEGVDKEFFAGSDLKSLVVVNVGRPGENAWFPRNPRLEFDQVVQTV
ncbi:MAG TPA: malonic semialdehyde reductase [Actinocrinis sp.]|jgi:3-hydroxypropanoate dehydrogenase|uniref:malonic semialdehyde reductase n=1 Tax=Actinocrinis sp. TaxID=1920516 RepID=UPI002DDD8E4E|nr:malonic semialdehyde reductase [Actinocrinis sp.]HEV3170658.1 malonic semialdehyde reductase [Actinocrinis sp.]